MATPTVHTPAAHTVEPDEIALGTYEIKTADLAEVVGVSTSTIHKWVKDDITAPKREDYFGGGRPGLVFDLYDVISDLSVEDTKQKYIPLLQAEVARRAVEYQDEAAADQWEQGSLEDVLAGLAEQGLVEEVDAQAPAPLPEILIEVLRHDLQEAHGNLRVTQHALAKIVRTRSDDDEQALFTYGETAAIHNALIIADNEHDA